MFFSATLSFATAAIVGASGLFAVYKSPNWRYWLFAAIPLLFAVQQFIEGRIWQQLERGGLTSTIPDLAASYVFIAEALWPIYIPLAVLLIETRRVRQYALVFAALIGILLFLFFSSLVSVGTYDAVIEGDCIRYSGCVELYQNFSLYPFSSAQKWTFSNLEWTTVPFTLVTVGALLLSSNRHVRWFGYLAGLGIPLAVAIQPAAFVSVWCFFAALASLSVAYAVIKARAPKGTPI
jgi:hypothetical protein